MQIGEFINIPMQFYTFNNAFREAFIMLPHHMIGDKISNHYFGIIARQVKMSEEIQSKIYFTFPT